MKLNKYTTLGGTVNVESECGYFMLRFARGTDNPLYHIFLSGLVATGHGLFDEDVGQYTIGCADDLDCSKAVATVE